MNTYFFVKTAFKLITVIGLTTVIASAASSSPMEAILTAVNYKKETRNLNDQSQYDAFCEAFIKIN